MLIDKHSRVPLYEQVIAQVERGILTGEFKADEQIPSVRQLSMELSVNPNTLQKAYTELERRGLCYTVPGNGRFVSKDAETKLRMMKRELIERIEQLARELKLSGIGEHEVIAAVRAAYADSANAPHNKDSEGLNK